MKLLSDKIVAVVLACAVVILVVFAVVQTNWTNKFIRLSEAQREASLRTRVSIARSALAPILQRYAAGIIGKSEACAQASALLSQMTYDDGESRNYFFLNAMDGTVLVRPYRPLDVGKKLLDEPNSIGQYPMRLVLQSVREHPEGSFVRYVFPRPPSQEEEEKLSYVIYVPELDAALGTGTYVEDATVQQLALLRRSYLLAFLLASLLAVPFGLFLLVVRKRNAALVEEMSKRRTAIEAMEQSRTRFQTIFETVNDAILILDPGTLRIKEANASAQRMFGYSGEEMARLAGGELLAASPDDGEEGAVPLERTREHGPQTYESRCRGRDGGSFWVEISTRMARLDGEDAILAAVRDVSERRKAEEALRESEAKFRSLFENMAEGVALHEFLYDADARALDYRILEVNAAFETQTGLVRENVVGQLASDCYGGEVPPFIDEYAYVASTGNPLVFDAFFPPLDRHFHVSVISPKKGFFATVFTDVTQEKISEQHLKESLHEKEVLLKEVHHRVKNNLQIISSLLKLQMLSSGPEAQPPLRESANRIATMALVHEHIYQSPSLSSIQLRSYVAKLASHLLRSFAGDKRIESVVDIPEMIISVDKAVPLGLVLNEVITNSVQHGFAGRNDGRIAILGELKNDVLDVRISDDGVGLPEGFSLEGATSLGLQLVVNLARQLDAALEVASDQGTVFSLSVPL
ncbi:cache domain-containing protein [Desulfovibrio sp. X2]|uniref:cache domain-containing protein n=1 Tax=Desulfovibrio sp. X2 TaxID=941449 RepID=UPI0006905025|nr:cache domain-containing protein [Desulfovibrio sp. X2]